MTIITKLVHDTLVGNNWQGVSRSNDKQFHHHGVDAKTTAGARYLDVKYYSSSVGAAAVGASPSTSPVIILACSASSSSSSSSPPSLQKLQSQLLGSLSATSKTMTTTQNRSELADGPLCQYRKGFLDHYKPKALVTSTLRVATQQGTTILAAFMSEQLEGDLKRGKLVSEGELTQREADEQAEEWEKVEWEKRWKTFPNKFLMALAKYHAVTIVVRFYEYVASLCFSPETLDKLTMDYFAASKTMSRKIDIPQQKGHAFSRMADTTFWANLLITLSDYSVHQILFCYGYYVYYQRQKKKNGGKMTKDDEKEVVKSCAISSAHLFASRSCGLVCSAIGAGFGTIIWPGWGTLMVSSVAESAGGMMIDDGYGKAMEALTGKKS